MYAIVQTGGKQYKVSPGDRILVEKLAAEPGSTVELDSVLMVVQGDKVTIGQPTVPNARVKAQVVSQGRGEKVVVFKYKAKTRYRRRTGHRQPYTELAIEQVLLGRRRRPRAAPAPAVEVTAATEEESGDGS